MTNLSPINPNFFKKNVFQIKMDPCPLTAEIRLVAIASYDKIHLDSPKDILVIGHHYHLIIEWKEGSQKKKFETTVKILSSIQKSNSRSLVEVVLVQYKKENWDAFLGMIESKQKEVTELLKRARGIEL